MITCIFSGLDSSGLIGQIFHYAMLIGIFLMTFAIFIYLFKEKKLNYDEKTKHQMFDDE